MRTLPLPRRRRRTIHYTQTWILVYRELTLTYLFPSRTTLPSSRKYLFALMVLRKWAHPSLSLSYQISLSHFRRSPDGDIDSHPNTSLFFALPFTPGSVRVPFFLCTTHRVALIDRVYVKSCTVCTGARERERDRCALAYLGKRDFKT